MNEYQPSSSQRMFALAAERYAELGVDVEQALASLSRIAVSLHCWQGDDVGGFEVQAGELGGGLAVTGNYPGRARTVEELRADIDQALRLIPGRHRLNLHASYGEFGGKHVARNAVDVEHFRGWIDWARERQIGLDFNPTFFAHPLAAEGFTLAHPDSAIRNFWIEHGIACRRIASAMGVALGTPCIHNVWVPDGCKETPVDRRRPRELLRDSLDAVFQEPFEKSQLRDAVEAKLFGIGSESYVAGSHEFYMGYAITRGKLLCLDAGHFHPTEVISDKISSTLLWLDEVLLHVSRGVRWDSDHVVVFNDELLAIAQEIVRGGYLSRVHLGLDFFDASINRVAAWVIGTRNLLKALLAALLEPIERWRKLELDGDTTARLALLEEQKTLPLGAVWDHYCERQGVPVGHAWLEAVREYEQRVQLLRTT
ncbi:MAG: L-rhamnose isomerase [Aureliella sp.]